MWWIDTRAVVINIARFRAVDTCAKFTTLALPRIAVRLHCSVKIIAEGVGVEIDPGCCGDYEKVMQKKANQRSTRETTPGHFHAAQECCRTVRNSKGWSFFEISAAQNNCIKLKLMIRRKRRERLQGEGVSKGTSRCNDCVRLAEPHCSVSDEAVLYRVHVAGSFYCHPLL